MAEKCEAKWCVASDAVQAVFGGFRHLAYGVGTEVGQLLGFHVAPDLLNGIEVRSIAWQRLNAQPIALVGDPVQHASAAVRWESIPDQDDRALLLMLMHFAEKVDQGFIVVGARTQLKDEVGVTAIGFVRQYAGDRQPLPREVVPQHGRLASGCPGGSHRRQQRHARLVLKHQQRVLALCPFFNCGQRFLTHCSMASSLRSLARRAGRCQVQSNWSRRMYQTWPGW